ncbi:16S rRNA (cytidine(1402)-2'-O)-methyltransferase [Paracoccus aurantiacus]|uniref:Ribosomal RNA small subunit methyltransferase I n=1 Tax=Paracoccus aurantiacus TaxID=2599412 RepID=A0A5C6S3H5_9RHOB|nr:16S rRNA (cytidine(1402)-2'-O)-methyltransferase [Paracoccus aurantiacus]TXB69388.1 16S rRNA (cytidine(1402)-2'-O)-methyltransferase [Paracoccus aurantiacus]
MEAPRLEAGLYLVATPIGTARDITLRALDVLNAADILAAEDTRTLRHLMDIHGVPLRGRRIIAYHDHNEMKQASPLVAAMSDGNSVAYFSEAGTPLVADPGFRLAREAIARDVRVHPLPGPSAALAALSVAGLPSDRFLFAGFPPQSGGQKKSWLTEAAAVDATVILFESPRRVKQTLGILCEIEPKRIIVLCRELTKKFEEVLRGTAQDLYENLPEKGVKGEVVLVLDRPQANLPDEAEITEMLSTMLGDMSLRDAATAVAEKYGISRRDAYQIGLTLGKG